MNWFMGMVHGLDKEKGLDLILHTPGGSISATESIINYLHELFGADIRAIVPQLAMSGGTMLACSCKEIMLGKQSSLGPIDPQLNGVAANAILEEFSKAKEEVSNDPALAPIWQPIIAKYPPSFIIACQNGMEWSKGILRDALQYSMFANNKDDKKIERIVENLSSNENTKAHERHLSSRECKEIGLNIIDMEDDDDIQDIILSIHHACMILFNKTSTVKIFSNNLGNFFTTESYKD